MTMSQMKTIELEEGWSFMQSGIRKLIRILEGEPEQQFSSDDYIMLYTYPLSSFLFNNFNSIQTLFPPPPPPFAPFFLATCLWIFTFYFYFNHQEYEDHVDWTSNFSSTLCTVPFIICALRSPLMITLSNYMTNTRKLLKNTSVQL